MQRPYFSRVIPLREEKKKSKQAEHTQILKFGFFDFVKA